MNDKSPKPAEPVQMPELRKRNEAAMQKIREELMRWRTRLGQQPEGAGTNHGGEQQSGSKGSR